MPHTSNRTDRRDSYLKGEQRASKSPWAQVARHPLLTASVKCCPIHSRAAKASARGAKGQLIYSQITPEHIGRANLSTKSHRADLLPARRLVALRADDGLRASAMRWSSGWPRFESDAVDRTVAYSNSGSNRKKSHSYQVVQLLLAYKYLIQEAKSCWGIESLRRRCSAREPSLRERSRAGNDDSV
jgi:hypothetical protein